MHIRSTSPGMDFADELDFLLDDGSQGKYKSVSRTLGDDEVEVPQGRTEKAYPLYDINDSGRVIRNKKKEDVYRSPHRSHRSSRRSRRYSMSDSEEVSYSDLTSRISLYPLLSFSEYWTEYIIYPLMPFEVMLYIYCWDVLLRSMFTVNHVMRISMFCISFFLTPFILHRQHIIPHISTWFLQSDHRRRRHHQSKRRRSRRSISSSSSRSSCDRGVR